MVGSPSNLRSYQVAVDIEQCCDHTYNCHDDFMQYDDTKIKNDDSIIHH